MARSVSVGRKTPRLSNKSTNRCCRRQLRRIREAARTASPSPTGNSRYRPVDTQRNRSSRRRGGRKTTTRGTPQCRGAGTSKEGRDAARLPRSGRREGNALAAIDRREEVRSITRAGAGAGRGRQRNVPPPNAAALSDPKPRNVDRPRTPPPGIVVSITTQALDPRTQMHYRRAGLIRNQTPARGE